MAELTQQDASKIINSRSLVLGPGKYQVKVTSITPYLHNERGLVHICNFNAMTSYHLEKAKEFGAQGEIQEAVKQNLTASQRDKVDYVPLKGEMVEIFVEEVTTKSGETGLFVTSLTAIQATKTARVSVDIFATVEEVEEIPA
jgi:hypothetical protein